tara:strand:+ start:144 stop:617 length:474 start_codon:yes stop_codon:yes gene_type:complete
MSVIGTGRKKYIDTFYGESVSEDEQRLESMKNFALEKALHEHRIPMSEDLKDEIFARIKVNTGFTRREGFKSGFKDSGLGRVYFPSPLVVQDQLKAIEDDPRFPSFSRSPDSGAGEKLTTPLSQQGRAVFTKVHKDIMNRNAEVEAHAKRKPHFPIQ